jgi:hypothetical protein
MSKKDHYAKFVSEDQRKYRTEVNMENTFEKAKKDDDFVIFFNNFVNSANYVMALSGDKDSVNLCIAYAYIFGRSIASSQNLLRLKNE